MQPKLLQLLIFIMLPFTALAQNNPACSTVTFQKEILLNFPSTMGYEQSTQNIFETLDKNIFLSGKLKTWPLSNSSQIERNNSYFSKKDKLGNIQWFKYFKDSSFRNNYSIQLYDSSYIIYTSVYEGATESDIIKLIKINKNGDLLWNKTIRYPYAQNYSTYLMIHSLIQTSDGNLLMYSNGEFGKNVTKLDTDANIIWSRDYEISNATGIFGYDNYFLNNSFIAESSDGYVITQPDGALFNHDENTLSLQLLKISKTNGNLIWSKQIRETGIRYYPRVVIKNDTEIIIQAYTNSSFSNELGNTLFKIDYDGNLLNRIKFIAPHHHIGSNKLNDGIICIARDTSSSTMYPYSILQFDNDLNLQWAKKYSFNNINETTSPARPAIIQSKDSSIYAFFSRPSVDGGATKTYMFKADKTGNAGSCESENININIYTPASNLLDLPMTDNNFSTLIVLPDTNIVFNNLSGSTNLICQTNSICDSINLTGNIEVCNFTDTIKYSITRNPACFTSPIWHLSDTSFGNIIVNSDTSIKIKFNHSGQVKLYSTIPTACGEIKDSLLITINRPANDLNLGDDFAFCGDSNIVLNAGAGYLKYLWQDGSTNREYSTSSPGLYFVTVTDFCNNIFRDTINIAAIPPEIIDVGIDINICIGDTVSLVGPPGFIQYQWQPGAGLQNPDAQITNAFPGTSTKFYLFATKSNGCISIDSLTINVNQKPALQLIQDSSICSGQSILLDPGNGYSSYSWNTGQTSQQITVNQTGIYILTVSDANGCMAKDSFELQNVYQNPVIDISNENYLCRNENRTLSVNNPGNFSYLWQDGSMQSNYIVTDTGFYKVLVKDLNSKCSGSDSIYINRLIETASDFLPADTTICESGFITISPNQSFAEYNWSTGSNAQTITIQQPGTYSLLVKNQEGCYGFDSININEKICSKQIFFPSAFTPNADGLNDFYKATAQFPLKQYSFVIYNRYGNIVFKSTNINEGWNGLLSGKAQNAGTYVWIAQYQFEGLSPQQQKGSFLLIR